MLGKKEPSMLIVGCDFHPSWQQIAVFDEETGEVNEYKLSNGDDAAEQFYRKLPAPARIGLEACGNSQVGDKYAKKEDVDSTSKTWATRPSGKAFFLGWGG